MEDLLPGGCDYDLCTRLATASRGGLRLCATHADDYDLDHDDELPPAHCDFDECPERADEQRGMMRYCPQHASEHDTLVAAAGAQHAAHVKRLADAEDARLQREYASEDAARDYRTAYYNLVDAVRSAIADDSLDGLDRLVAEDC